MSRPSASFLAIGGKTWMPGTRPGMTENVNSGRSAKAPEADWQGAENRARMAGKSNPQAPSRRHQDGPHDISHYLRLCFGGFPGRRGRSGAAGLADRRSAVGGRDQRSLLHAAVPAAVAADPPGRTYSLARPADFHRHRPVLPGLADAADLCLEPGARAGHHLDARQPRSAVCGGDGGDPAARAAGAAATPWPYRCRCGCSDHHRDPPARPRPLAKLGAVAAALQRAGTRRGTADRQARARRSGQARSGPA